LVEKTTRGEERLVRTANDYASSPSCSSSSFDGDAVHVEKDDRREHPGALLPVDERVAC
jgi:hypothetical protein